MCNSFENDNVLLRAVKSIRLIMANHLIRYHMHFQRITTMALLLAAAVCATAQKIKGSDTVLPVTQEAAEAYMAKNPSARVTVTGGGSGVGISALVDGTTDIAMSSRSIKFNERVKLSKSG